MIKEVQPFDSFELPTKNYTYFFDGTSPESIKISQRTTANKTYDTYYFYDGLGNFIQLKKPADNNQQIIKNFYYNGLGQVVSEQNPYFDSFSVSLGTPSSTVAATNYSYDALGRVYSVLNPDGTSKSINFNHYTITAYDENAHRKSYVLFLFVDSSSLVDLSYQNGFIFLVNFVKNSVLADSDSEDSALSSNFYCSSRKRVFFQRFYFSYTSASDGLVEIFKILFSLSGEFDRKCHKFSFLFTSDKETVLLCSKSSLACFRALTSSVDNKESSKYVCLCFIMDNSFLMPLISLTSNSCLIKSCLSFDSLSYFFGVGNSVLINENYANEHINLKSARITNVLEYAGNLVTQIQQGGGNLISGDGYYREYDSLNQLIRIRNGSYATSPIIENYSYDPFGQRVKIERNDSASTKIYTPFKGGFYEN